MKREVRQLLDKGIDVLVLAVEHFNRPSDRGRTQAVLIFIDHAFEMLLKAGILHRGGRIRERRAKQTLGFDACVRKALTDGTIKFLSNEQALTVQAINGLRDAAQHHVLYVPEQQLYLHAQAGLTLFAHLLKTLFDDKILDYLPERVLPLSTSPPKDLSLVLEDEFKVLRAMLRPGKRQSVEARARVRALAIFEAATKGERVQPSEGELGRVLRKIAGGAATDAVFPGVSALSLSTTGEGIPLSLRITKKEGIPVHLVREGTADAAVVAVRRVDELGFYSLGHRQLAAHLNLSEPKTTALIRFLKIREDAECYKDIQIGKSKFCRYSPKAVEKIKAAFDKLDMQKVWEEYRPRTRVTAA
jgi:hypothetical protein